MVLNTNEKLARWLDAGLTTTPPVEVTNVPISPITGAIGMMPTPWFAVRTLESIRVKGKSPGGVQPGQVATISTAGSGYNGGSVGLFYGVELTGGGGTGAKATVTIGSSGEVTRVVVTHCGTGYTSTPTGISAGTGGMAAGGSSCAITGLQLDSSGTAVAPGVLGKLIVAVVDSGSSIEVYDGYDATGTLMAVLSSATATTFDLNLAFVTGLFLRFKEHTGGTTPDVTVLYL